MTTKTLQALKGFEEISYKGFEYLGHRDWLANEASQQLKHAASHGKKADGHSPDSEEYKYHKAQQAHHVEQHDKLQSQLTDLKRAADSAHKMFEHIRGKK